MHHHQIKTIKVPDEWVISGGRGVTVAIVDSDIGNFKSPNIIKKYSLSNNGIYRNSHCSAVCEIITKVAPYCKIIVSQALNNKVGDYAGLIRAIDNIKNDDFDIVNFSLSTKEDKQDIKDKINLLSKKAVLVAAMANDYSNSYPAMYDNVVSVSSFKKSNIDADIYCDDSFMFGDDNIKKTGNSMSTAFVSGIFALAKSYNKDFTKEDIVKQLLGK